jgi:hypothetical protein
MPSQEDAVDAPTSASQKDALREFLTYGKFVTQARGPVLLDRDYSATSRSNGLPNWKVQALRPARLLPKLQWAPGLIDQPEQGCLVVIPIDNSEPKEEGVALARIRYRSEIGETDNGENKPGRVYQQSTAWFVPLEDWQEHAPAIVKAANGFRADPDVVNSSTPRQPPAVTKIPRDQPDLNKDPALARIVDRILTHIEGGSAGPLVLGAGSFDTEAKFLAAVADAMVWLDDLGGVPFGFTTGLAAKADGLILHWVRDGAPALVPLSKQQIKTLGTRRSRLLSLKKFKKKKPVSKSSMTAWKMNGDGGSHFPSADQVLDWYDKRKAAQALHSGGQTLPPRTSPSERQAASAKPTQSEWATTKAPRPEQAFSVKTSSPERQTSVKTPPPERQTASVKTLPPELQRPSQMKMPRREDLAPWQKCLKDYNDSPTPQSASALFEEIDKEKEEVQREDMFPDSDDGLHKLVLIAAVAPRREDLPLRYVPFQIIDWGLKVIKAATAGAASPRVVERVNKAADLLKERVNSAVGEMGVLCPGELDELGRLEDLLGILRNEEPAVKISYQLYAALNPRAKSTPDRDTFWRIEDAINARIARTEKDKNDYGTAGEIGEVISGHHKMLLHVKGKLRDKRMPG